MVPSCTTSPSFAPRAHRIDELEQSIKETHTNRDVVAGSTSRAWNVKDYRCLPRLPPFYVLEETRTAIRAGGASPSEVADRISRCLLESSLDAKFDDGRAEVFVKTANGVEFYVRLFRGGTAADPDDGSSKSIIIVEVQRKRGSAIRFRRHAQTLLLRANGTSTVPPKSRRSSILETPSRMRPSKRPSFEAGTDRDDSGRSVEAVVESSLDHAYGLVTKDRLDAKELGMEIVVLLTDEESVGTEKATYAAKTILCDDRRWTKEFLSQITKNADDDDDESLVTSTVDERRHREVMRRCALTATANSLRLLHRADARLCSSLCRDEWIGRVDFLSTLIHILKGAEERPHDAREAARCLNTILGTGSADSVTRQRALDLGISSAAAMARTVGRLRHPKLGKESDILFTLVDAPAK